MEIKFDCLVFYGWLLLNTMYLKFFELMLFLVGSLSSPCNSSISVYSFFNCYLFAL